MENKSEIRRLCKSKRGGMMHTEVSERSEVICRKLIDNRRVQSARQLLVYAATQKEVDLTLFVEQAWQMGKQVYFPKVHGEMLEFHEVSCWDDLKEGYYHIMEPARISSPLIPDRDAVVCVPGVAFSESGNRIGFGAGYYDRYLEKYPYLYKIGLAYELQMAYTWTPDDCDIAMDLLVSENREVELT